MVHLYQSTKMNGRTLGKTYHIECPDILLAVEGHFYDTGASVITLSWETHAIMLSDLPRRNFSICLLLASLVKRPPVWNIRRLNKDRTLEYSGIARYFM